MVELKVIYYIFDTKEMSGCSNPCNLTINWSIVSVKVSMCYLLVMFR